MCIVEVKKILLKVIDLVIAPFVYPAAVLLKTIRRVGVKRMPRCKNVLLKVGVFPIQDHYYEPLFNEKSLRYPLSQNRNLPGINWDVEEQLEILDSFHFNEEMREQLLKSDGLKFFKNNMSFGSGDAEYLYNIIRLKKPLRIFEIGSGNSTLMAIKATRKNAEEVSGYNCKHICIEPYEMPWLESIGVKVIRQKVEDVGREFFSELDKNDILFIDSSHIIRPQGDVLFEYLELLPSLKAGVIVHVHDIFSPRDYSADWVIEDVRFWNEQYLLEAFLTSNRDWKIISALNYLQHNYYDRLRAKCPFLSQEREPGSFYIQKIV